MNEFAKVKFFFDGLLRSLEHPLVLGLAGEARAEVTQLAYPR